MVVSILQLAHQDVALTASPQIGEVAHFIELTFNEDVDDLKVALFAVKRKSCLSDQAYVEYTRNSKRCVQSRFQVSSFLMSLDDLFADGRS